MNYGIVCAKLKGITMQTTAKPSLENNIKTFLKLWIFSWPLFSAILSLNKIQQNALCFLIYSWEHFLVTGWSHDKLLFVASYTLHFNVSGVYVLIKIYAVLKIWLYTCEGFTNRTNYNYPRKLDLTYYLARMTCSGTY